MKITLTPQANQNLTSLRTAIAEPLARFNSTQVLLAKLREERPGLEKRVADLVMATDHADEAAVNRLIIAKGQLDLLLQKIPLAEELLEQLPVHLFARLGEATPAIKDAVRPALDQLRKEVTASLRPHFGPGPGLEDVVETTPAVVSFHEFFYRNYSGGPANAVKYGPIALEMLDELISGKTTWSFKPE